jgi:hypothetical protein
VAVVQPFKASTGVGHLSMLTVAGPPRAGSGLGKKFCRAPNEGGSAKNIYIKSERLTLRCRGTRVWYERVNLYSLQIMILLRKAKTYATYSGYGNLYRLFLPTPPPGAKDEERICEEKSVTELRYCNYYCYHHHHHHHLMLLKCFLQGLLMCTLRSLYRFCNWPSGCWVST